VKPRWHYLEYLLARSALGVVDSLPPRGGLCFADLAGRLAYALTRRRCALTRENIRQAGVATDEAGVQRIALRSFQSFTRMFAETALLRNRIGPDNWRDFVELKLDPAVAALLQNPRQGIIAASAHLGNWEVAARAFSMVRPVSMIYRPFRNPHVDRYFTSARTGSRLRLISKFQVGPRRLLEALAQGDTLALMIDQRMPSNTERMRVNFFGRPAWTTRSIAMMHLATRVPIVVACAVRTGHLKFTLHITGPFTTTRTGRRDADAQAITEQVSAEVERRIRAHPDQYMWGHRRWVEPAKGDPRSR